MDWLTDIFANVQQRLFEAAVQPLVYAVGLGGWVEEAFDATGWLLVGLIQIAVLIALIGPLQRWRPVEPVVDRPAIRTDILYTLIHRLGLFRLAMFFALDPLFDEALGAVRGAGSRSTWWCWTLSSTSSIAGSTGSIGGGHCIRCTIRSAR